MSLTITIDNYEEIMFRLVEDDFDESTRIDLLQQIEADALFKFEWESWQKTKSTDPLENYSDKSRELTEKIILIAEPQTAGRKRFFYYWSAAASIMLLIGILFLLTSDFSSRPKQEATVPVTKSTTPAKNVITPVRNNTVSIAITDSKQTQKQKINIEFRPLVADSNKNVLPENPLAEIPHVIDSIPIKANVLANATEKKPRYTITIETSDISSNKYINNDLAKNQKVNIKKVLTNTKMLLSRKPNGEPDKIYIIGDENSYLCINLNYTEK